MPTFVPYYGDAANDMIAPRSESLVLSDGAGDFSVDEAGRVTVLSGYPNVGQVFHPGNRVYDQVIKNLSAVGNNRARLVEFLGAKTVTESLSSPAAVSSSGAPATTQEIAAKVVTVPLTQRRWFWPAVVSGSVLAAGAGWMFFRAR